MLHSSPMKTTKWIKQTSPKVVFFLFPWLSLPSLSFLVLKEAETKAFWCGYSLYVRHCSLVWGASFRNTGRREWKDREAEKKRTPGELYITGSDGIQTNQKGRRGLLLWSLTVVFPKVEDDVTTWRREIGHRRHRRGCRCTHACRGTCTITHSLIIHHLLSLAAGEKRDKTVL